MYILSNGRSMALILPKDLFRCVLRSTTTSLWGNCQWVVPIVFITCSMSNAASRRNEKEALTARILNSQGAQEALKKGGRHPSGHGFYAGKLIKGKKLVYLLFYNVGLLLHVIVSIPPASRIVMAALCRLAATLFRLSFDCW